MSTINNTDVFPVSRSGTNYQVTAADMVAFMGGGGSAAGADVQAKATTPTTKSDGTTALTEGDLYYNTADDTIYAYNGTAWKKAAPQFDWQSGAGNPTTLSITTRSSGGALVDGDTFWDTTNDTLYAWSGTAWAQASVKAATTAEATTGTLTTAYSSPATAVPKSAAGMTGAAIIPGGDDIERAAITSPAAGMLRYNDQGGTPVAMEYYDGAAWTELATGGGAGTIYAWARVSVPAGGPATLAGGAGVASVTYQGAGNCDVTLTNPIANTAYSIFVAGQAPTNYSAPADPVSTIRIRMTYDAEFAFMIVS